MPAVPPLAPGECQVWWAPFTAYPGDDDDLDETERARRARFVHPPDGLRYAAAHVLARRLLGAHLGVEPGAVAIRLVCTRCGGAHGKPFVDGGPEYSLTHGGDLVAVAVTRAGPVGVDVESSSRTPEPALARRVLAAPELVTYEAMPAADRPRALLRSWTRKEAVLKATGEGLARPTASVDVSGPVARSAYLTDLALPADHVGAVAVVAAPAPVVRQYDAAALLA